MIQESFTEAVLIWLSEHGHKCYASDTLIAIYGVNNDAVISFHTKYVEVYTKPSTDQSEETTASKFRRLWYNSPIFFDELEEMIE